MGDSIEKFLNLLGGALARRCLHIASDVVTKLERDLAQAIEDKERLHRKAQYVADLAYNKGVRDAQRGIPVERLIKTPRHQDEFRSGAHARSTSTPSDPSAN